MKNEQATASARAEQEAVSRKNLTDARRMVIKVGTKIISSSDGSVDREYLSSLAEAVAMLRSQKRQVLIVSSGAIGMGSGALGLNQRSQSMVMRQACASIGQPLLMQAWRQAFLAKGIITAQILVTRDLFNHRERFNNLKVSIERLLKLNVIPIINENDSICTEEIETIFGDNDQLSAYVTSKTGAELLVILSDVDGLYESNPRYNPEAGKISYVKKLLDSHRQSAVGKGSAFSSGGMETKLKAVEIARDAGSRVVLAHGRTDQVLQRICAGENEGTLFEAAEPLRQRSRWIKNAEAQGCLEVDEGAMKAVLEKRSLLPRGIRSVEGIFHRGAVILVNKKVKLVSGFDSSELEKIMGRHSDEIKGIIGTDAPDVIARPEDMVIL